MNNFEKKYKKILLNIIYKGDSQLSRNGETFVLNNIKFNFNLKNGFPILTSRKMYLKNFIYELIWFINGDTNIKYLKNNNVNIWDLWADENGELGPVYGYQLRKFNNNFDQLNYVINELKNNKFSRRAVVNLWNPTDLDKMKLPPCHYSFQINIFKNKLNMSVIMRSCDMALGFPNDFSFYAAFLIIISKELNVKPGNICFFINNGHLYKNQIESITKYINNKTYSLPTLTYNGNINNINFNDFCLINYKSENPIKINISK